MNIPAHIARAQGTHGSKGAAHGIKGAVYGIKGGRPRLALTDDERAQRRRDQQLAYRRRKGIMPKEVLSWEERRERDQAEHTLRLNREYRSIWRKPPGVPLTSEEFAKRYVKFRAWVRSRQDRSCPLYSSVHFVRDLIREERRREREEPSGRTDAVSRRPDAGRKIQIHQEYRVQQDWMPSLPQLLETPTVGRNQPCPCASGRKFKKCCGS